MRQAGRRNFLGSIAQRPQVCAQRVAPPAARPIGDDALRARTVERRFPTQQGIGVRGKERAVSRGVGQIELFEKRVDAGVGVRRRLAQGAMGGGHAAAGMSNFVTGWERI